MTDLATWEGRWAREDGIPSYFSEGEYEKLAALREELFDKYLQGITEVSEFGAGLGHNLVPLLNTGRRLRAFDWSLAAVDKCRAAGLEADEFDMLHPRLLPISGAILTVHAMEQLGDKWWPFFVYLLAVRPTLCIHIEPIAELYNHTARDLARLAYHRSRGYLSGYYTELQRAVEGGSIEILEARKSPFGGKDHDAYSVIVWRPL